jgi:hypothetical protein
MPNGQSVIPPEKLQKEFEKGTLRPPDPNAEKEVDGDMDEKIDKVIQDIWNFYDPKGTGIMPKKVMEKFFKVTTVKGETNFFCFGHKNNI